MRRNDHDVTDSVRTTDPAAMYAGADPQYCACDTGYHDIQHVLDVTLAMARLIEGYQRSRRNGEQPMTREVFIAGILAALFHDFGYLRRRNDRRHRYGAEYTLTHVSRGAAFLRRYVRSLGLGDALAHVTGTLVHYTGYERPPETIRLSDTLLRRVGQMLGSADILAQMADRCYLE